ncbi:hypothetical protein Sango_2746900 [Sesamum angolense]|uniref:Uncharacterized protein n=1 Tax=Sesamum angolense TaxID=2727404 RepID=A0AAE1T916_9LAMI|nr:hypothetical protein Sango_2746900 [Sesamum angolense]
MVACCTVRTILNWTTVSFVEELVEPRNVRLGLCTDGFTPHGQYGHMMVIPGPSNPKCLIDIYLGPLIEELQNLWMASGWSTRGAMGCPVCMEDTCAFCLQNGRKTCYFDCHRQFVPPDHPYRRNKKTFTKKPSRKDGCTSKIDGRTV